VFSFVRFTRLQTRMAQNFFPAYLYHCAFLRASFDADTSKCFNFLLRKLRFVFVFVVLMQDFIPTCWKAFEMSVELFCLKLLDWNLTRLKKFGYFETLMRLKSFFTNAHKKKTTTRAHVYLFEYVPGDEESKQICFLRKLIFDLIG